jgi:hypothetical protein
MDEEQPALRFNDLKTESLGRLARATHSGITDAPPAPLA